MIRYLTLLSFLLLLLINLTAQAGGGHEHGPGGHGDEPETTAPVEPTSPRLIMESSQFELVAILEHDRLILYLDDYATNAPVKDANLELEIQGERISVNANQDGSYQASLAKPLKPGKYPVLATVLAQQTSDLLIGDLLVPEHEVAHEEKPVEQHSHMLPWWIAGAISLLAIIMVTLQRDRHARRETT